MNFRNSALIVLFSALSQPILAADAPAPASTESKPNSVLFSVSVNGVAIPSIYNDLVRNDLLQRRRPATDKHVIEVLVDNELLSQEAIKQGIDKSAEIQALLNLQRKDLLGKTLVEEFAKNHPITEERIKSEYQQIKTRTGEMEYHSRHILVDDEKTAKSIITQLGGRKPAKFEDLAKKHSKDPGSAKEGGDLGWMAPGNLVPEFSAAMTALKKGQYTKDPVKTQFGWHVIKLEEERKIDFPDYEQVKARIAAQLIQIDVRKYLMELRSSAKIEVSGMPAGN